MLDGILNRGFSSKCKSLMKATRTRIEVVRRRAEAKQRFLKEDLAKLLSNGLDINAYGRTEEFLAGEDLLACYDFIEQLCEYIAMQLSSMQKERECQEECREAVASLMFAAARFSDLPELRDLRDLFQERYGSALECFVNQRLMEKLSPTRPVMEKRLQLLQDIASELSIKWDSKGFEQRMAAPSILGQTHPNKYKLPNVTSGTSNLLDGSGRDSRSHKYNVLPKETRGVGHNDHRMQKAIENNDFRGEELDLHGKYERSGDEQLVSNKGENTARRNHNDIMLQRRQVDTVDKQEPLVKNDTLAKAVKSGTSSHGKLRDIAGSEQTGQDNVVKDIHRGKGSEVPSCGKSKNSPSYGGIPQKNEAVLSGCEHVRQQNEANSIREVLEGEVDNLKSYYKTLRPPPYVKSRDNPIRLPYVKNRKPKSSRSEDTGSYYDGHSAYPSPDNRIFEAFGPNWIQREPDNPAHEGQNVGPTGVIPEKAQYYLDDKIPLPKAKSVRRKQHKSLASHNDVNIAEDGETVKRRSTRRRRENSQKVLQTLFDADHHRKDEEEKMIDKLLLHYSKKPSSYDVGKLRKKSQAQPSLQIAADTSESSHDQIRDGHDLKPEMVPPPTRSISLPHEQTAPSEAKKVFTRANSFQPDSQAPHVHPKLPDYDDLAAQFAAFKGR